MRIFHILCLVGAMLSVACQPVAAQAPLREPERIVARVGGPELVFERPVAQIVPMLENARPSGPNGRVGSELVFWGYELATNRSATLVACAVLPDVDCAARLARVCQRGMPEVLFSAQEGGEVRHRNCQAIGFAQPGDLSPNCVDTEQVQPIAVTLLSCN